MINGGPENANATRRCFSLPLAGEGGWVCVSKRNAMQSIPTPTFPPTGGFQG